MNLARRFLPPKGPESILAASTLVDTFGKGMFLTVGVIFLTRGGGLSPGLVGAGLSVAGLVALGSGVLIGDWADRWGARPVLIATLLLEAVAAAGFAAAPGAAGFIVAATLAAVGAQGSTSARGALIAMIGGPQGRVVLRARLRALTNVGISVGALVGGLGLGLDSYAGYVAMLTANAVTFVVAAALVRRLPAYSPTRKRDHHRRWLALRDGPYLAVAGLNAVQCINYTMLTVAVPLWVSERTAAPRWIVAPLLLVNTLAIVLVQVRATRSIGDPGAAARALRRAGGGFAIAWTLIGISGDVGPIPAIGLLTSAIALHSAGELWQAAAQFELSFALAAPSAQGQYQGVFGLGQAAAGAVGPIVATGFCLASGATGWILLGVAVAMAGAAAPATVAWAERHPSVATPTVPETPKGPRLQAFRIDRGDRI